MQMKFDDKFLENGKFRIDDQDYRIVNFYPKSRKALFYHVDFISCLESRIKDRENPEKTKEECRRFPEGSSERAIGLIIKSGNGKNKFYGAAEENGLKLYRSQVAPESLSGDVYEKPQLVLQYWDIGFDGGRGANLEWILKYKSDFFQYINSNLLKKTNNKLKNEIPAQEYVLNERPRTIASILG